MMSHYDQSPDLLHKALSCAHLSPSGRPTSVVQSPVNQASLEPSLLFSSVDLGSYASRVFGEGWNLGVPRGGLCTSEFILLLSQIYCVTLPSGLVCLGPSSSSVQWRFPASQGCGEVNTLQVVNCSDTVE